jgi:ribonuclease VapC
LAFRRFGRGRHPAGLKSGDCAAYELASTRSESLLFRGEEFAKTNVIQAAG